MTEKILVSKEAVEILVRLTAAKTAQEVDKPTWALAVAAGDHLHGLLELANRPFGLKQGVKLTARPTDRKPIFSQSYDAPNWTGDMQHVAYMLQSAVERAAPYVKLDGGQDPLFYDRAGYFAGVLDTITARGFDTYENPLEGFAIYPPRHPVPAVGRSFGKVASYAPKPN